MRALWGGRGGYKTPLCPSTGDSSSLPSTTTSALSLTLRLSTPLLLYETHVSSIQTTQHAWLRNCWLHVRRLRMHAGCLQLRQISVSGVLDHGLMRLC